MVNIESHLLQNIDFAFRKLENSNLLRFANELPCHGILKQAQLVPYVYLKVDDDFIHKLLPLMNDDNLLKPDDRYSKNAIGAHISVIYSGEVESEINIAEIDQPFSFSITGLFDIEVFESHVFALLVSSRELIQLRQKYGFDERLNYHGLLVPFHITIAKKSINYTTDDKQVS